MFFDRNYRLIDTVDVSRLAGFVEAKLRPLYSDPEGELWRRVKSRCEFIGCESRPADIGFRRMRPVGYMQLCLLNDEEPYSPWALSLPAEAIAPADLQEAIDPIAQLCERHFGAGVLYFCVFAVLAPGGQVPPHRDMPHDVNKKRFSHHLHLPLTASKETEFMFGGEVFQMEVGNMYEVNNMVVHSVRNLGTEYRVNLMLDYCADEYVMERNAKSPDACALTVGAVEANHVA